MSPHLPTSCLKIFSCRTNATDSKKLAIWYVPVNMLWVAGKAVKVLMGVSGLREQISAEETIFHVDSDIQERNFFSRGGGSEFDRGMDVVHVF